MLVRLKNIFYNMWHNDKKMQGVSNKKVLIVCGIFIGTALILYWLA
jgi:hypothetical protein